MIVRHRDGRVETISQHAHSWLSGDMGRHWAWAHPVLDAGGPLAEEFLLGACEHDLGYLEWEVRPDFDPGTGLPFNFLDMTPSMHIANWQRGINRLKGTSYLGSLMVSRHACLIFRNYHDESKHGPGEEEQIEQFLREQDQAQLQITGRLIQDSTYAMLADEAVQRSMSHLLRTLDVISLYICMDVEGPTRIDGVPKGEEETGITFTRLDPDRFSLAPWPFRPATLDCRLVVRSLAESYASEEEMQTAWSQAQPWSWRFQLVPGKEAA